MVVDNSDEAALARMTGELERLVDYADAQERKVSQLQDALESRVVIEQAVGMLAERFGIDVTGAFDLLRGAARDSRRELRTLAVELLESRATPEEITAALSRA